VRVTGAACYFSDTIEWLAAYQDGIEFYAFFAAEEIASIDSQPLEMPLKRSLSALLSKSRSKKEYPATPPQDC
jgi:hypothetical protein